MTAEDCGPYCLPLELRDSFELLLLQSEALAVVLSVVPDTPSSLVEYLLTVIWSGVFGMVKNDLLIQRLAKPSSGHSIALLLLPTRELFPKDGTLHQ